MKRILIARSLLAILVAQVVQGCSPAVDRFDASQQLIDGLTSRFDDRDYVNSSKSGILNPHENLGQQVGRMYQEMLSYNGSSGNGFFYGNTLVPSDPKRHEYIKGLTKKLLAAEGIEFNEEFLDQVRNNLSGYRLTSESLLKRFDDAEANHALTSLEHKLLILELQQLANSRSVRQMKDIIATVEYEVMKSGIDSNSKEKILMINAVARNLALDPGVSKIGGPLLIFSDTSPFKQTGAVVLGILVIAAVAYLVEAFLDPNCNATCQQNHANNVAAYASVGAVVYSLCEDPCFWNGVLECVCP